MEKRRETPSPLGGKIADNIQLDNFLNVNRTKSKINKKEIKKFPGNYAKQSQKLSSLVKAAKMKGKDPLRVRVRYCEDDNES